MMRENGKFSALILSIIVMLMMAINGYSQETTGSIQGVITDGSGAAVAGARVEASGSALVRATSTVSDKNGSYTFQSLPPGIYTITTTSTGFNTTKTELVEVLVGKQRTINVQLKVGEVAESVVVTSDAPIIEITQNKVGTNITEDMINNLPKGRSFDSLLNMAPGARAESKSGGVQIDGASGSENIFVIDGVDVTNLQSGVLPRQSQLPTEFMQEIQIKSSGFEAKYGGAVGGVVSGTIKSGGNQYHGQASLHFTNSSLAASPRPDLVFDANDPEQNTVGYVHYQNTPSRFLNPSFSLGGPIINDKLWFFTGYSPMFNNITRTTSLRDGSSGTFERKERQDWITTKLDYAPLEKLRTFATYIYSPYKVNGYLPSAQGTDGPQAWDQKGYREPSSTYPFGADYTVNSRLLFSLRGGYNYRNYKDYGIERGTRYRFANSNRGLAGVPTNLQGPAGNFTPNNQQTVLDQQTRFNISGDVSYIANFAGQHNFSGGYQLQRLHNKANASTWPDGYIYLFWNQSYDPIVGEAQRGTYGYYINREFATKGDVSSSNQGIYIHDQWQASRRLTLNLGLRTEREYVPSFRTDSGIASRAIEFSWGDKIIPRLGFAYDLLGNGKVKVYSSYSMYYDLFKYELPRGSFGGDVWKDYYYTLNDADFTKIKPGNTPGTLIELRDLRVPSNSPDDYRLDPDLKPMRQRAIDAGIDYSPNKNWVLSARYTHKWLDRAIEDVGVLVGSSEVYYIANPGFGLTADASKLPAGYPVTPKAKRVYDALEFRADKRLSRGYTFSASYTYSRLYGNYSGLASSDENGRTSPSVNRYFDLPYMSFDANGKEVLGLLATDRPHTIKFFGSYNKTSKLGSTSFGPSIQLYSGTPITSEVNTLGVPVFAFGRGDMGRTPFYSNFDFLIGHEFKPTERYTVRFEANFTNLFNQSTVTGKSARYTHENTPEIQFDEATHYADFFKGFDVNQKIAEYNAAHADKIRLDPRYGMANSFQGPRRIRFAVQFRF